MGGATYLFAGLLVSDRSAAVEFYTALFGESPDVWPNDDEAMWQVVEHGSIFIRADPARAGGGRVAVAVDDLDAFAAAAVARGVPLGPIETVGHAGRKCVTIDTDANAVEIVGLVKA